MGSDRTTSDEGQIKPFLVDAKPDHEIAAELRKRLDVALAVVTQILNDANRDGLNVTFNIGRDQMGRNRVMDLTIVRPL